MKLDNIGAIGGKTLLVLGVVGAIVLASLSGLIAIEWPGGTAIDKYSEVVNRHASDIGIKVPIQVRFTFDQDVSSGENKAYISANIKHKHDSADSVTGDVVPDATLITRSNFNTQVANVNDNSTIFCVAGTGFQASNIVLNSTIKSLAGVEYGNAQVNPKVWTKSTTYTPPTTPGATSKDNGALIVQTVWEHYRKGTNELLSSDTITWVVYYEMPKYNADSGDSFTQTYFAYIPFNDYALIEDIKLKVFGFRETCIIEWTTISAVTHTFWDFPVINGIFGGFLDATGVGKLKLVQAKDVTLPTAIQYHWDPILRYSTNNDNQYGSHSYTYKIR